ncbi:MAG: hypothetical protein ACNI25_07780 [Halarcobacter sp.]
MKKTIILISILLCSSLFAKDYTQAQRITDMGKMAEGLSLIQKGFLYRCTSGKCFDKGGDLILGVVKTLETQEMKDFLPTQEKYAYKFGEKSARMIELYVDDLKESVKNNNMQDALEDYNQILRQCTSCHIRLRK